MNWMESLNLNQYTKKFIWLIYHVPTHTHIDSYNNDDACIQSTYSREMINLLGAERHIFQKWNKRPFLSEKIPTQTSFHVIVFDLHKKKITRLLFYAIWKSIQEINVIDLVLHTHTLALLFYFRQINGDKIFVCFALLFSHANKYST